MAAFVLAVSCITGCQRSTEMEPAIRTVLMAKCGDQRVHVACLDSITDLDLAGRRLRSLDGVEHCHNLLNLDVSYQYLIESTGFESLLDLASLKQLSKLEQLNIQGNALGSLPEICGLQNLRIVDCSANRITDFQPFTTLPVLRQLDLTNNDLERIDDFGASTNLEVLVLSGNPLREVYGLESLLKLKELRLDGTKLGKIPRLAGLHQLETLSLRGVPIQSLEGIEALRNLKTLDVRMTGLPAEAINELKIALSAQGTTVLTGE